MAHGLWARDRQSTLASATLELDRFVRRVPHAVSTDILYVGVDPRTVQDVRHRASRPSLHCEAFPACLALKLEDNGLKPLGGFHL